MNELTAMRRNLMLALNEDDRTVIPTAEIILTTGYKQSVAVDGKPVVRRLFRDFRIVVGIHEAESLAAYLTETIAELHKLGPSPQPPAHDE